MSADTGGTELFDGVDASTIELALGSSPPVWTVQWGDDLRLEGYEPSGRECIDEQCNGDLWKNHAERVCDRCSVVLGQDTRRKSQRQRRTEWEYFHAHREKYRSGRTRCVGGYPHAYDWGSDPALHQSM